MAETVAIITEDLISEVIAERIIETAGPGVGVGVRLGRKGYNYVLSRLRNLNEAAEGMFVLALLDRDTAARCPIEVIAETLGGPMHRNMVIRFAEMEAESWILGDREGVAEFLGVQLNRLPAWPDTLQDPKQFLVNLASRSRSRQIRNDICPRNGSTSRVGPAYNERLEQFLRNSWRIDAAIQSSPSLSRAVQRISALRTVVPNA